MVTLYHLRSGWHWKEEKIEETIRALFIVTQR